METFPKNNKNILIIEHIIDSSRMLAEILTNHNYQIHCADSAEVALKEIDKIDPSLILLDLTTYTLENDILWEQLTKYLISKDIPIIFLIDFDDTFDIRKIHEMGGRDYITKPYQVKEVLVKVSNQFNLQFAKSEGYFWDRVLLELQLQEHILKLEKKVEELEEKVQKYQEQKQQLAYNALHDSLTNLPNRALLRSKIDDAIQRTKRNPNYLFALLFIDVDRFKTINDSLGHLVGDRLLIAIARLLSKQVRDVDTVARLGGDEFVILVEDIQQVTDATYICDRILNKLQKPILIGDWTISTSISIGIAFSSYLYQNSSQILHDADIAMYLAKENSQASYEIFDRALVSSHW